MERAILTVPARVKRGQTFEVRAMVAHPMETGFRSDNSGATVPRNIVERFVCNYNGSKVFGARFFPSITANPFLAFSIRAADSGEIACSWTDDRGQTHTETARILVE